MFEFCFNKGFRLFGFERMIFYYKFIIIAFRFEVLLRKNGETIEKLNSNVVGL